MPRDRRTSHRAVRPLVQPGGPTAARRIAVVGDALLDRDVTGSASRLCPDGVGPVVDVDATASRPGGAALAAALVAGDGRPTTLLAAVGEDAEGSELRALLHDHGVDVVAVRSSAPTPTKVRVRLSGATVVRLDLGCAPVPAPRVDAASLARLADADAILASDYGRGLLDRPEVRRALAAAARDVPLVWDPHPNGRAPVAGCTVATPNLSEARRALAAAGRGAPEHPDAVARALAGRWRCAVVVTCGADGALVARPGDEDVAFVQGYATGGDACGAGDRFAGRLAAALADGAELQEAADDACLAAAGLVTTGPPASSTSTSTRRPVTVAAGGCFDVLHAGHVRMLGYARSLGDRLVVLLNDDDSVRRLKGPSRPLNPAADRRAVLLGLSCVDDVVCFSGDDPCDALVELRPDVFVKGAEYAHLPLPERELVARWGGRVELAPMLDGRSTTRVLRLLRAAAG